MTSTVLKPASSWLLAAGLLTLLLVLASLQYRWLDEVSQANRDKSRDLLVAAVDRFAEDFDRELTRAFFYLQPRAGWRSLEPEAFALRYEHWRTYAPFPDLVRDVTLALRAGPGHLEASRFEPAQGVFTPIPWPEELTEVQLRLTAQGRRSRRRSEPRDGPGDLSILADEIPALILPMVGGGPPGEPPGSPGGPPGSPGGPLGPGFRGYLIIRLDLETIRDVILPRLAEQHLHGGDGVEYEARVVAQRDQHVIFHRGAAKATREPRDGDANVELFSLLSPEKLGTLAADAGLSWRGGPHGARSAEHTAAEGTAPEDRPTERAAPEGRPTERASGRPHGRRFGEEHFYHRLYRVISSEQNARWRLEASHPAGSLDAAVATAHRRNLAISFGILLLLGSSLMLMLWSTRRLQALARQQLEFVASVTHELLTPLAAMRSAGQNLADGIVAKPQQVRRYGRLVDNEGRRLSTMVEQVLEFSGIQAGRRSYALERTSLTPIVEGALAEYRPVLEERDMHIEKSLADDLPDVMADGPALRRAVQNLIANAVKYGAPGSRIGIRAVTDDGPKGTVLRLSIEDQGSGIADEDLEHIFEPFYRGKNGSEHAIPGGGLGLSLVQHIAEGHGGRVTVKTKEGTGSTFTLHLPAVASDTYTGNTTAIHTSESADEL